MVFIKQNLIKINENKNQYKTDDISKKKSEYSKQYEVIAKNLNEKEAKDRLAKLLRNRYERISRR